MVGSGGAGAEGRNGAGRNGGGFTSASVHVVYESDEPREVVQGVGWSGVAVFVFGIPRCTPRLY